MKTFLFAALAALALTGCVDQNGKFDPAATAFGLATVVAPAIVEECRLAGHERCERLALTSGTLLDQMVVDSLITEDDRAE